MNDSLAGKHGVEIVLAGETPFELAGSRVQPAALEIEHDGSLTAVEPRVMQVLVALHRGRGEPLSRDALIDLCWGGRVVTEGAVNRCIAQLRKALSTNPRVRVETIPKVGYRLLATGAEPQSAEPRVNGGATLSPDVGDERSARGTATRNWKVMAAGLLAVVAVVVVLWQLTLPRPVTWAATNYRPVTTEPGLETHPALSPTGAQIVYTVRATPFATGDLFLRNVDQGAPIQLTTYRGDDYAAAWSPNGDRIAFTRSYTGPCALFIMPIPRGPERLVTRCRTVTQTRASWLDERTLVFADAPAAGIPPRIRAVDIETGNTRDLTAPSALVADDSEPVVSPDGKRVVFRRTLIPGVDDLYTLDVASGRERALTRDGWKASGYVWSSDGRHVFFSSNRGGEFGLWSVDLEIDGPPRQVSLGLGTLSFSRMSLDRNNRLAVEMVHAHANLARVSLDGTIEPMTTGAGSDSNAAVAADGTIAFISARSGSYQVWITQPGSEPTRVTSMRANYATMPAWSPDGNSIAFVAVIARRAEIFTVARDGSELRQVTHDGNEKRDPVYSVSGDRLFYVGRRGAEWGLQEIATGSAPRPVTGGEGWTALRSDRAGHLYGKRGNSIAALDAHAPMVNVELTSFDAWAAGAQGLYVRRGRTPERPSTLWLHPWNGPPRKLADVPLASSSIAVDVDGRAIFSQTPDYQVDLGLIELRDSRRTE